ncbi:hypothetical protein [Wolbachia endosymbiont (group A) of Trypoxylon clavicerum]|uniref:hypothetical protein n=1 Tax=Wolbachia endosymbiont (group A) of Trypoxylon clavicerum TaxID=2954064 RepID=UPI0022317827|nr:hypothetical protein [Wolbachia endosymbiont (group A) of Trypoxylon clavicerum]
MASLKFCPQSLEKCCRMAFAILLFEVQLSNSIANIRLSQDLVISLFVSAAAV